jgi:hypothetical protein
MKCVALTLFTLVLLVTSRDLAAQNWQNIGQVPAPQTRGASAFFFNANEGIIGTGDYYAGGYARLFYTTDGGVTWIGSIMPNMNIKGQVTDVWFRSRKSGWATITEAAYTGWSGLYKSTDAGRSWKLVRQSASPVSVRENSRGVFFTDRGSGGTGIIFSGDDGKTFSVSALNSAPLGIDFLDDLNGYVSSETGTSAPHMRTTDGGVTWNGYPSNYEAWGVFAERASGDFIYAAEKDKATNASISAVNRITKTNNLQMEWSDSAMVITGGIAGFHGCTSTIYAQGQGQKRKLQGFIRSTDNGNTWTPVGGPSNAHDTRFAVTGRGAVVYAFDNFGNIFKTMNGGDGTLRATVAQDLSFRTVQLPRVESRECDSITIPIELQLANCDSARILRVEVLNDPLTELIPLTISNRFIGGAVRDTMRIRFRPQQIATQIFRVRITLEQLDGFTEDTVLEVTVKGLPAKEIFTVGEQSSPNTIDFGKLNICTGDSVRIITLTNIGCGDLNVNNITLTASAFELRSRISPIVLSPTDDRKYLVRFRPKTLGAHGAWLVFHTLEGRDSIRLTGEGIPGQRGLQLTQPTISSSTCDSVEVKLKIRNTSCGRVELNGLTSTVPITVLGFVGKQLESDSTIEVTIRFAPKNAGTQTYSLNVDATIGGAQFDTTLTIQATADAGKLELSSIDRLEFDTVSTCSQVTLPIVLRNTGCATLNVSGSVIDGTDPDFSIAKGLADPTLLRGETDTIWITFKPGSVGQFTKILRVMSNAGERDITLHGFGQDDRGDVVLSFNDVLQTEMCMNQDFTVRINNGSCDDLVIDSIGVSGNDGDFIFPDLSPQGIKVGDAYDLFGQFAPTAPGTRRITVRVYYTDASGHHFKDIDITGIGTSSPPLIASLSADSTMRAKILEDITMPIYVRGIVNGDIQSVEFALGLNTDLLTPKSMSLEGTEMEGARVTAFDIANDSVTVRLTFDTPRRIGEGILGRMQFRTFLTDTMTTSIELLRFSASGSLAKCLATSVQSTQLPSFTLDPECGDQFISEHMSDRVVSIAGIHPNPSTGRITMKLNTPGGMSDATVSVYDASGRVVLEKQIGSSSSRTQDIKLDIPGGAGQYFVRVQSQFGTSTRSVVVRR